MSRPQFNNWQAIQAEVLRRIHAREWPPGHDIPGEVDLAREFGCARATVNRALQALADAGILERRRKAGTRVALHPVGRAVVDIPVIRQEIEGRGMVHGYDLLRRRLAKPGGWAVNAMTDADPVPWLHLLALHTANGAPYVIEDRWINLSVVGQATRQEFTDISANEWLLSNVPYTHGGISFFATEATAGAARLLQCTTNAALFVTERTTWDYHRVITSVRLSYAPGHRINSRVGAGH